jgi:hypothetical protein
MTYVHSEYCTQTVSTWLPALYSLSLGAFVFACPLSGHARRLPRSQVPLPLVAVDALGSLTRVR